MTGASTSANHVTATSTVVAREPRATSAEEPDGGNLALLKCMWVILPA